jgi:membrane fusion protein, heavy metal efflux system
MQPKEQLASDGFAALMTDINRTGLRRRSPFAVFCLVSLLGVLLAGCWPDAAAVTPPQPPAKDPNLVRVTTENLHQVGIVNVELVAFPKLKQAIGQIAFNEDASTVVQTPFSGRVTRVLGKIGDDVKLGDPLFEIDSPEVVQAQTDLIAALHGVDKAKSALFSAQRQAERASRLIKDKAVSQREADQAINDQAAAESDFKTAEGTLTYARHRLRVIIGRDQAEVDRLESTRIVNPLITINSPINGTIIARKIGPGAYVRADIADPLYSIADLTVMWLKANVPEIDAPLIRVGQEIEVKVAALPDRVFNAHVIAIGAASDATTRRVTVRSEIPNPDRSLKSEMFASFKILVGKGEPSPSVPSMAVIWEGERATVWSEREPLLFERRLIKAGLEQDGRIEIRDGLKMGDRVIGRGAIFVQNESQQ